MKTYLTSFRPQPSEYAAIGHVPSISESRPGSRIIRLMLGMVFLLCIVLTGITTDSGGGKKGALGINANIPLYEDSLGWSIWSAKSGAELVDWYTTGKFRAYEADVFIELSAFEYMMDEPERFMGFALKIPDGLVTFWSKNSAVVMTCAFKNDTCTVRSEEFVVQRSSDPDVSVKSGGIKSFVAIGGGKCDIFRIPKGIPILFFKFPIQRTPEAVVRCRVENVLTKGGKK